MQLEIKKSALTMTKADGIFDKRQTFKAVKLFDRLVLQVIVLNRKLLLCDLKLVRALAIDNHRWLGD
jgi:hypothetical protein